MSRHTKEYILFCIVALLLFAHATFAHSMLRIEVCGGAGDVRECKAGVDEITNTGGMGDVTVGCSAGDPNCTVKDQNIKINPIAPMPTPSGWTAPVPPAIEPTPPSTFTSPTIPSANVPTTTVQNWDTAMGGAQCVVYFNTATSNTYFMMAPSAAGCPGVLTTGYTGASLQDPPRYLFQVSPWAPPVPGYNCPNYTGATRPACTLQNAALVVKPSDNKCTIKRVGNTFSGDTRDPDCSVQPNVSVSGSAVTITPVSSSVETGKIEFQTDGSGYIEMSKPNTDGTTTKTRVTFGPPNATTGQSITTGTSSETYKGTGTSTGTTPQGEMPTDYNRETTQQAILSKLQEGTTIDETGVPTDSSLSAQKSLLDDATTARITAIEGSGNVTDLGLGLSITWPTTTCVDPSFEIPGTGKNLVVSMCDKRPDIQLAMNWLISILAAFSIFQIGAAAVTGKA